MFNETERLVLREFSPDDFTAVHEYSSDYENVKHMMFGPNTPEQTRSYLEGQCVKEMNEIPRMHYNIAFALKENNYVIGGISLHMNWRRDDAILGVILNKKYTGHGYVTEAFTGVIDYAFDTLKLHRLHAVCDVKNKAIQSIMEKLGFRNEGTMIQRGKARPEESPPYFDQYGYAILADEWKNKRINRF